MDTELQQGKLGKAHCACDKVIVIVSFTSTITMVAKDCPQVSTPHFACCNRRQHLQAVRLTLYID
jgi:hypothetical protein